MVETDNRRQVSRVEWLQGVGEIEKKNGNRNYGQKSTSEKLKSPKNRR